jgi:hypothetical protein
MALTAEAPQINAWDVAVEMDGEMGIVPLVDTAWVYVRISPATIKSNMSSAETVTPVGLGMSCPLGLYQPYSQANG